MRRSGRGDGVHGPSPFPTLEIHRTVARLGSGFRMREPHHPARNELELSAVLHALSDPARLEIVRRLADDDEPSCGMFELGLSKATLSHHFRVLRESGVVLVRPEGRKRLLSLRTDDLNARFPGLIEAILAAKTRRPRAKTAA
jgi:DNA-binding transcriptional ArsR family regulator